MIGRLSLLAAAVAGASGVLIGALTAHAASGALPPDRVQVLQTAVDYQLIHALALAVTGVVLIREDQPAFRLAAYGFAFGVVCFCGSLYVLAFSGPSWLGPVTPLGGIGFVVGWLALGRGAWKLIP